MLHRWAQNVGNLKEKMNNELIAIIIIYMYQMFALIKKNAYALKTPHVVVLPFIYGVECIQFHTLLATLENAF